MKIQNINSTYNRTQYQTVKKSNNSQPSFQHRKIYEERWQSVKDATVFVKNQGDFLQGTFKRDEFKAIAKRTPATLAKEAFSKLKQMARESREKTKGRETYDGPEL